MVQAIGRILQHLARILAVLLVIPKVAAQGAAVPVEDMLWLVMASVLVFLMQAGFALLGAGAVRSKNAVNYLVKSIMDFALGAIVFFVVGYAFMFGAGTFIGKGFGVTNESGELLAFLFQAMFAATAATIVAGAVAERMQLRSYVVYTIAITAFIYPVFGHWVWGGGPLASLGAVDFAGSGVVHAVGGLLALVAAWLVGARKGRFDAQGTPQPMPGHNQVYVILGTLLLFFGWFGFNAGSTLSASDPFIARIAVNTFLAGCAGAVAVYFACIGRTLDLGKVCNGMLAGLVAVTGPCAFIAPWAAIVVGAMGGLIYLGAAAFLERRMRIDDPVGAIAVHGVTGIFGVVAVGIFADGSNGVAGLIVGDTQQIIAQLIMAGTLIAWTLGTGFVLFKGIDVVMGLRISDKQEQLGLDAFHHTPAYPETVEQPVKSRRIPDVAMAIGMVLEPKK